jgi:O-antigen/teichoic acid export membrane protein
VDVSENNKTIAKNTVALYFRTLVTLAVSLYTGRVMLEALGVKDYGINAVVGGIIAFSSLITSTMTDAISRYITYALGQGNKGKLKMMFSTSINAQICISAIAVILLELIGVWFLSTQAQIPDGRFEAASWVLHCSIVSLVITLVFSPLTALIVAHERMTIYAYTSIVDAFLKLGICFAIIKYGGDRLILFAVLSVVEVVIMQLFYGWYCGKYFEEAKYSFRYFDKGLLKELSVFSGWNLMNNGAYVFSTQGVNMLVNVFFGVVYNASRSVAIQVNSAVQSFVNNFTMAFSPQITKCYAAGDVEYSISLVIRGTKFSWMMMLVFLVPVFMEADSLLSIWLVEVPDLAALFLRLALFESLAVTCAQNLFRIIQADGRIKQYSLFVSLIVGLIFPLVWLAYILGAPVWSSYIIFIVGFVGVHLFRLFYIKSLMSFSIRGYLKDCIIPCVIVSCTSFIAPLILAYFVEESLIRFLLMVPLAILWTILCCYYLGFNKQEKEFIKSKTFEVVSRFFGKKC